MKKSSMHWIILLLSVILAIGLTSSCVTVVDKKPGGEQTAPQPTTKTSPPVINSFTANPDSMAQGQSVNLNWNISGALDVTISPTVGQVDPVSTVLVSPEATTTYTLTASNDAGTVTATATITVTQAAPDKPDLVITDIWIQVETVYYKIKNLGSEQSPGSRTHMYVNEIKKVQTEDYAEPLAPGEEKTESFGRYEWKFRIEPHTAGPFGAWAVDSPLVQYLIKVCADNEHSVIEGNEDNNCRTLIIGDKITLEFKDIVHIAKWATGAGILKWPIPESNKTGAAFFKQSVTMEDGKGHALALGTYPEQVNGGWIQGVFSGIHTEGESLALMPTPIAVPRMAKFTSQVGFKKEATDTDGVWFIFGVAYESGLVEFFPGIFATYDEKLDLYEVDLSELAGEKVSFILRVEDGEGDLYQQNHAVWIDPKIIQEIP